VSHLHAGRIKILTTSTKTVRTMSTGMEL